MAEARLSGSQPAAGAHHALVVAGGDVPVRAALDAAWPGWADGIADVVAADSGFERARSLGILPDLLVGDLDSLPAAVLADALAAAIPILRSSADKDETDTELALLEAVARGAHRITVLGAFGGPRLDHALANVWLLAHPALAGVDVALLDASSRAALLTAPGRDGGRATRLLPGPVGGVVSLLPFGGDAEGITTSGLRYRLDDEVLATGPARGVSNVRVSADAAVSLARGSLLIVESAVADGGLSSQS